MALNRPQPPGMGSVAALLAMDRTTLTAALKPLERRGLVRTAVHPDDRRSRLMSLTDAGMALLGEALPIWERTHAEVERQFGGEDVSQMRRSLRTLAAQS